MQEMSFQLMLLVCWHQQNRVFFVFEIFFSMTAVMLCTTGIDQNTTGGPWLVHKWVFIYTGFASAVWCFPAC